MRKQDRLAASEKTAARILDMAPNKFRDLVSAGALPPPIEIGGEVRWRVADLEAALDGSALRQKAGFDL